MYGVLGRPSSVLFEWDAVLVSRFFSKMVYSAAITDGFIRDTEEVNARISPTRIAIEQSSSHVYLVQVVFS